MIPFNDIKIDPKKLLEKLLQKIDNITLVLNDNLEDIIKNIIKKELTNELYTNHFWYLITGKKICTHRYKYSKKYNGHMCGKVIYSKHEGNIEGQWLCSRHFKEHESERHRTLKEDDVQCKAITLANTQCLYSAKIDGYCNQHYKCISKIKIKEIHDIIEEINLFNNIEYDTIGPKDKNFSKNSENIKLINNLSLKRKNSDIIINNDNKKIKINIFKYKKKIKKIENELKKNNIIKVKNIIYQERNSVSFSVYYNFHNILNNIYYSEENIHNFHQNYNTTTNINNKMNHHDFRSIFRFIIKLYKN